MGYNIIVNQDKNENFFHFTKMRIKDYNDNISPYHKEYRKPGEVKNINIIVEDINKEWIGGLVAETIAMQQGCHSSQLNTYEFQAKAFYEKHGYIVVGKLENYPPGSAYYWMSKIMDLR